MKRKKILHVLASNSFSGAENVVCTIIENDNLYDMYYCSPKGTIEQTLKERHINYIPLVKLTPNNIKKVCKENNIDIIHAHDYKASFMSAISGFKGKIISHIHCNYSFMKSWNIYTILYSLMSKKFYKIAVVSSAIINEAVFKNKIKNKCIIINNVVDSKKVKTKSLEDFNKKYDFIFIGRIIEEKNPILFIEIISELCKNNKSLKAAMIGCGTLESKCKEKILKLNINDNVDMLGFQDNPYKIIKNSKIVIMPSLIEGFGLTAIESMCLNKPVLNSGVGGLGTIFKNNPEFICNSKECYIKLSSYLIHNNEELKTYESKCKNIIAPYINIKVWKEKIYNLYK